MPRTFLVNQGRTVTLPQGLQAGPGASNMRLNPGAVVTLEDDVCNGMHARFIAGRLRQEDWTEIDPADAPKEIIAHEYVSDPINPTNRPLMPMVTGGPAKKDR